MSQLAVSRAPRRARTVEAKANRARALEDAALALLATTAWPELAVADVAARAGVAKGTLYLYFPTKESLGLALVERLLDRWFDDVLRELAARRAALPPAAIAQRLVAATERHQPLVPLLSITGTLLEQNAAPDAARRYKSMVLRRTLEAGAAIEQAVGTLSPGDGARFLLHTHALVTGLHRMAEPAPVVRTILRSARYAPLRVDFATELTFALTALLAGLAGARTDRARRPT